MEKEDNLDLKNKVEALLFASGKKLDIEFLESTIGINNKDMIKDALYKLKKEYEKSDNSLMIIDDESGWKINVKEKYLPLVRKIVSEAELSKTIMETLAIIAWKSPVLQSDVITIRTNKAYDHINELLDSGFITKEKHGRSYILKVTNKFYEYFDVEGAEGIREVFAKIKERPPQKKVDEFKAEKQIPDKIGELDVVETKPDNSIKQAEEKIDMEKLGNLEIYEKEEHDNKIQENSGNDESYSQEEDISDDVEQNEEENSLEEKTKNIVNEILNDDEDNDDETKEISEEEEGDPKKEMEEE